MRKLITAPRVWTGVIVCGVALAGLALATRHSDAATIDCSPPPLDGPTISFPDAAIDEGDYNPDISLHGELVGVESRGDSYEFTILDDDRGELTLDVHVGGAIEFDLVPRTVVTVNYVRWVGTGMGGAHLVVLDSEGLVLAVEEGSGTSGVHPPFVVTNVSGGCKGRGPTVQSALVYSADGAEVSAAAGETATLSADGCDYLVHTFYATEIVDFEAFDVSPQNAFVIARIPERDRAARSKTSREGDQ